MTWIYEPAQDQIERTNVWRFLRRQGCADRESFLRWSVEDSEGFWRAISEEMRIDWFQPYSGVLDASRGPEWSRWFIDGKLNIAHNCLDRHVSRSNPAIIAEDEDGNIRTIPFAELHRDANRLANALIELGLRQGDRIALVMPMVPEVVTILYAAFKAGLVVVPIFAGFGAGAIATRLDNSGARVVFTADGLKRRGKRIPLREKIQYPVEHVIVLRYQDAARGRDLDWHELLTGSRDTFQTEALDSEAPAFILYTSGTTGKPKGVVHTHAGSLVQTAKEIYLGFDHKENDRFWWLSDIGWMMGPWTVLGNHNFGGTIFLYDGAPDYPGPNRLWEMIDRHRITTFGVSPTAIRLLMRTSHPEICSLDSLRLLGSTGEPWDDTSYVWFFERIGKGRCPIINISGGTEIIGCFLIALPIQKLKVSTLGAPAPGMATEVVDEEGRPVRGKTGYLVCTKPAPSMARGIWGDPERYVTTYWSRWPGIWDHGDWASVDADGCWFLHGRADESMNVAGRKVGPAEVEDCLIQYPAVSEAAVIGVPDEIKGEGIVAFVVLRREAGTEELSRHLIREMGPTFKPNAIHVVAELPKTQSGKIVRRLIRRRYLNEELGDTSTVANPESLAHFAPK